MTVSLERPVGLSSYEPELPVYPSLRVTNEPEPGESRQAVLTLRIAVDRDMLAAALDLSSYDLSDPDSWSVEFIRDSVELQLGMDGAYPLWRDSRRFPDLLDDPSVRDRVAATYRAIDRAYPQPAPPAA
ncbi:hypothetical protein ACWCRF_11630 [Streptomyces sp. NPDC002405]